MYGIKRIQIVRRLRVNPMADAKFNDDEREPVIRRIEALKNIKLTPVGTRKIFLKGIPIRYDNGHHKRNCGKNHGFEGPCRQENSSSRK